MQSSWYVGFHALLAGCEHLWWGSLCLSFVIWQLLSLAFDFSCLEMSAAQRVRSCMFALGCFVVFIFLILYFVIFLRYCIQKWGLVPRMCSGQVAQSMLIPLPRNSFEILQLPLCVTSIHEIKRGRELPDYLDTFSFSFSPSANSPKLRLTSQLWEELHILLLSRALRVGCCTWHRVAAAPWSMVAPGSNTALVGLKRACPAAASLWLWLCQAWELRAGFFGIFFFFFNASS